MSVASRSFTAALALAAVFALSAPAVAQQAPTLGAPATPTTTSAPPPVTTSSGNGGLATWQELLIFGAGIALILGIAFAILGDARERAAKLRHGGADPATAGVPHKHRQQAKERARAKAKAAKEARRRNR
jgi:hypothetical protein